MRGHHAAPLIPYTEGDMLPLSQAEHNSPPICSGSLLLSLSMLLITHGHDICNCMDALLKYLSIRYNTLRKHCFVLLPESVRNL